MPGAECIGCGRSQDGDFWRSARRAGSSAGHSNRKPSACAFAGTTRWPVSSAASAISPSARRSAKRGARRRCGRRSTRASVAANSSLVTGAGAVGVQRAGRFGAWSAATARARSSPAGESTTCTGGRCRTVRRAPRRNGSSMRASAPPSGASTMPLRSSDDPRVRRRGTLASSSHCTTRPARKSGPGAVSLGDDFVAARAVVADRRTTRWNTAGGRARSRDCPGEAAGRQHAALDEHALPRVGPPLSRRGLHRRG